MKLTRSLQCCYIQTDGSLIEIFEELRGNTRVGQTADITMNYCTVTMQKYVGDHQKEQVKEGRIVVSGGKYDNTAFVDLAKGGRIRVILPSLLNGSPATKERGLTVQYLTLITAKGKNLKWIECPTVCCSDFTPQEGYFTDLSEKYEGGLLWDGIRIWKIKDPSKAKPKLLTAAA